jgi:serine/threonine protein kinase
MFSRDESGYGSSESLYEDQCPEPNFERISADELRLKHEFQATHLLMQSANGVLYTGNLISTGTSIILKQIPRKNVPKWVSMDGHLVPAEIGYHFESYKSAKNPSVICEPIAWLEKKSSFVLVLEKIGSDCLDLFELSKKYGAIMEEPAKIIFGQLLDIWENLNESEICHRDLKDENIIINIATLECKLIDYGCATKLTVSDEKNFAGTPEFYPPEWFAKNCFQHESLNSWSMGTILFILLTGQMPPRINMATSDVKREGKFLMNLLSKPAQELLVALLEYSPAKRASLETAKRLFQKWCL